MDVRVRLCVYYQHRSYARVSQRGIQSGQERLCEGEAVLSENSIRD